MKMMVKSGLFLIEIVNSGRQSDIIRAMVNDRVTGNTFTGGIRIIEKFSEKIYFLNFLCIS